MNTDSDEFAEGGRSRTYPDEWGVPPGDRYSEERARWVREQCARFAGLAAMDRLAAKDKRHLQILQRAVLMARRVGP